MSATRLTPASAERADTVPLLQKVSTSSSSSSEDISFRTSTSTSDSPSSLHHNAHPISSPTYTVHLRAISDRTNRAVAQVFNKITDTTASQYQLTAENQQKTNAIYQDLWDAIASDATSFTILVRTKSVIYKDAQGVEHIRNIDDLSEENPEIAKLYIALETHLILSGVNIGKSAFDKGSITSTDRAKPLVKTNSIYNSLPNTYTDAAKKALETLGNLFPDASQDEALKRIVAAERIMKVYEDRLKELRDSQRDLSQQFHAERDKDAQRQIGIQLQDVNRQLAAWEKQMPKDRLALYSAVACFPFEHLTAHPELTGTNKIAYISQVAGTLKEAVGQEIQKSHEDYNNETHTTWKKFKSHVPFVGEDLPELLSPNNAYAVDVAGLLFEGLSSGEGRVGYDEFCREQNAYAKAPCEEGFIVRCIAEILSGGITTKTEAEIDKKYNHIAPFRTDLTTALHGTTASPGAQQILIENTPAPAATANTLDAKIIDYKNQLSFN